MRSQYILWLLVWFERMWKRTKNEQCYVLFVPWHFLYMKVNCCVFTEFKRKTFIQKKLNFVYLTMLGWSNFSNCLSREISLKMAIGTPSSVKENRIFFNATIVSVARSRARYTVPYAPEKTNEDYWNNSRYLYFGSCFINVKYYSSSIF